MHKLWIFFRQKKGKCDARMSTIEDGIAYPRCVFGGEWKQLEHCHYCVCLKLYNRIPERLFAIAFLMVCKSQSWLISMKVLVKRWVEAVEQAFLQPFG